MRVCLRWIQYLIVVIVTLFAQHNNRRNQKKRTRVEQIHALVCGQYNFLTNLRVSGGNFARHQVPYRTIHLTTTFGHCANILFSKRNGDLLRKDERKEGSSRASIGSLLLSVGAIARQTAACLSCCLFFSPALTGVAHLRNRTRKQLGRKWKEGKTLPSERVWGCPKVRPIPWRPHFELSSDRPSGRVAGRSFVRSFSSCVLARVIHKSSWWRRRGSARPSGAHSWG